MGCDCRPPVKALAGLVAALLPCLEALPKAAMNSGDCRVRMQCFLFFLPTLVWEANSGLTTLEQEELAFMKSLLEPLEPEKRLGSGFEPPSSRYKVTSNISWRSNLNAVSSDESHSSKWVACCSWLDKRCKRDPHNLAPD